MTRTFRIFLLAVTVLALLAPAVAQAAPPTDLRVFHRHYAVIATWTVPAGMRIDSIEISRNADGSDPFITPSLAPRQNAFDFIPQPPGTYYVRVAAVADPCTTPSCGKEYSEIKSVTIPVPPSIVSVGQTNGRVSATWVLAPGTESSLIEIATSDATETDSVGEFVDWVTYKFLEPDQTTHTFDELPLGEYYLHVSAYDPLCEEPLGCPVFSDPVKITIPPDPAPAPLPIPTSVPQVPQIPADKVTSFAKLKCASTQKVGTLVVQAAMPENGTITVGGTVSVPNSSKVFKLKRVTVNATAGKTVKIKVKLPGKAQKAARRALKRHRKVKAGLTVTARDAAGNTRSEKRSVKLKR
jgi:hypothetical protein